jgi:hypothetical protein
MKYGRFDIVETDDIISANSGLALVNEILDGTHLKQRLNNTRLSEMNNPKISNYDVIKSFVALLTMGRYDYDQIELFREDDFFKFSMNVEEVPSAPTLRQRLDMAPAEWSESLNSEWLNMLKKHEVPLTPCIGKMIPLDIDVSPFDNSGTKREGVSYTYKGFEGYSPIFAYLGKNEGWCVATELREGSAHSQCDKGEFIRKAIKNAKELCEKILLRVDSAHDSIDTLTICVEDENVDYIIKRNLRKEPLEKYIELMNSQEEVKITTLREGKVVRRTACRADVGLSREIRLVFEVVERTIDDKGVPLLMQETEVNAYWTSLELDADTVIRLYEEHGTSEQFHSEIKTDIGLERFPSGKMKTNGLVLSMTMLAYNILRLMGQKALKYGIMPMKKDNRGRVRLKTVIQNIVYMAVRLVRHARQWILSFGKHRPYLPVFRRLLEGMRC